MRVVDRGEARRRDVERTRGRRPTTDDDDDDD
jgi:hypothetical protein